MRMKAESSGFVEEKTETFFPIIYVNLADDTEAGSIRTLPKAIGLRREIEAGCGCALRFV